MSLSRTKTCTGFVPFPDLWRWRGAPGALAARRAGHGFDRRPGSSGDLRNLPIKGLDIGLCPAEFRARYLAVRGAATILVENVEENELLDTATGGTSAHLSIPTIGGGEAKRHQSLQIAAPPRA